MYILLLLVSGFFVFLSMLLIVGLIAGEENKKATSGGRPLYDLDNLLSTFVFVAVTLGILFFDSTTETAGNAEFFWYVLAVGAALPTVYAVNLLRQGKQPLVRRVLACVFCAAVYVLASQMEFFFS